MIDDSNPENPEIFKEKDSIFIEKEMENSFLDYAMSVIVSRALPDVCDGLKPVHRRIIYAMNESGYTSGKPSRKSARIVGDVMGKYHPHGDSAIYDAMVRMAQHFSMRVPLIEGQGNFGSMDGDSAAAMRYTEAKLSVISNFLVNDIDNETVSFRENYDGTVVEPVVLPAEFPNLFINGSEGIAVGMATKIPPHCPNEVIDACYKIVNNPNVTEEELLDIVKGPDFPTGGIIIGKSGIRDAYLKGKGSIMIRAKTSIETSKKGKESIIISEVPYSVKKSYLIENIARVAKEKIVEGISELRDESNREGVRVVIDLKRDIQADVVLNQLFKFTPLQTSFGINLLALNNGIPELLNLRRYLNLFTKFRKDIIFKRTKFHLNKTRDKAHLLLGLSVAIENIDKIITIIRNSKDSNQAKNSLMTENWKIPDDSFIVDFIKDEDEKLIQNGYFKFSEAQSKSILEIRLSKLTGLERNKLTDDLKECVRLIEEYLTILSSKSKLNEVLSEELLEIKTKINSERKTEISENEETIDDESLIRSEEVVVTLTNTGYIKRVPLNSYRSQKRGGKGRSGMTTKEEDFVNEVFVVNTLTPLLFFSSQGLVYKIKTYKIPIGSPTSKGKALVNLLPLRSGEKITTTMPYDINQKNIIFATSKGNIRRNKLTDFHNINVNGKIAMKLNSDDMLVNVVTCSESDDIFLSTRLGKCIRFSCKDLRVFSGRASVGVRGIRLTDKDAVISLAILNGINFNVNERDEYLKISSLLRKNEKIEKINIDKDKINEFKSNEEFLLSVTDKGFGKRSSAYEYRKSNRGGLGIANMQLSQRNGNEIIASFPIKENDQLMLVTNNGQLIRCPVNDVRIAGRQTQGVTLFNVSETERVVSVAKLEDNE
ncbi:MAG: DNA gyrase subunit A [Alphaproteobacteria bacterium]